MNKITVNTNRYLIENSNEMKMTLRYRSCVKLFFSRMFQYQKETTNNQLGFYTLMEEKRGSEIVWHQLLAWWCESDVDSEEL